MINLREKRTAKGLTQQALANKIGVIRQTISNIECGVSKPSVNTAIEIGKILNFNWTEFFED